MHAIRHWLSFFTGAVLVLLGLFPLMGRGAWLGPLGNTTAGIIAAYIVAFGGIYIIVDSFFEFTFHSGVGITTLLVGLLVLVVGLITILHDHGKVGFAIPGLSPVVYHILFILEGAFLMVACFVMD